VLKKENFLKGTDLKPYSGRWIAIIRDQVVGHGGTPEQAFMSAKNSRHKEIPEVIFVPMSKPLIFSPILESIGKAIPSGVQAYLVGGAVRDAFLNRKCHDYDLIIPDDPIRIGRTLADYFNGAFYLLDIERETARVIVKNSENQRVVIDLSKQRGKTLEADLRDRDFTINAMAINLNNHQEIYDPLGGGNDLLKKVLRACSPDSLQNDPIRVLRSIRIAVEFGLQIHPETRQFMREALPLISNVSPERVRDEIFRILGGKNPAISLRALDRIGAIPLIFPELPKMKGINQSIPHTLDAWGHTLETIHSLDLLITNILPSKEADRSSTLYVGMFEISIGGFRKKISDLLLSDVIVDRSAKSLLFLGALYHDIGKPESEQLDDNGRVRFLEHEKIGSRIIEHRASYLCLSNQEIVRLKSIVKNHMRPTYLAREVTSPDDLSIYRYFRDTGSVGVEIGLLSLADLMATYGTSLTQERWEKQLNVFRRLIIAWWQEHDKLINPPKLLTGTQIMNKFNLTPGPQIGNLLESLREAQIERKLITEEDAYSFLAEKI
jgi:putative nucleotidyltransferase with HDIG domain